MSASISDCVKRTVNHLLNLSGGKLADGIGDGNVGTTSRGLLGSSNLEDTVDINLENDLESGLSSPHGGDGSEGELSQRGVVSAVGTLTLVNGELHGCLVIDNGGESALLDRRDSLTTGHNRSEDVTLHSNTERKGNDIKQEEVLGFSRRSLSRQDTGLDGGTIGNGLIGVDAL